MSKELVVKTNRLNQAFQTLSLSEFHIVQLAIVDARLMCAEKTGGFNLVNYRHSSGVYHEQETEDLHRRI